MSSEERRGRSAALCASNQAPCKPRIGVFKFASCDGCQLSILDLEDELLALAGSVEIAFFPEASTRMLRGPYEIGLVEGSITTPHDAARIRLIRNECRTLVSTGACATAGGIQALRNFNNAAEWAQSVYPHPEFMETLATATPIARHVRVDFELRGCPVNKYQLLEVLSATLAGRKPIIPTHSVCMDCKQRGNHCVIVARGMPCLGPVTQSGCGAVCPAFGRGCYGCFGPAETANAAGLAARMRRTGVGEPELERLFQSFNADAWQLQSAGET